MLPASMSCSKPRPEFYLELLLRVPCSSDSGCAVNKYLSDWMRICDIYHIGDVREMNRRGLMTWGRSVFQV
jgi:hypothetical protein